MILRCVIAFMFSGCVFAQTQTPWGCKTPTSKQGALRVRVSDGVTNRLADRKVLPDISDLSGQKLDSLVVINILIAENGDVSCTRLRRGNPDLLKRSQEAAMNWHFRPYEINGQLVEVDTVPTR
jgi:hypothetical protein